MKQPNQTPKSSTYQAKPFRLGIDAVKRVFNENGGAATGILFISLIISGVSQALTRSNQASSSADLLQLGFGGLSIFTTIVGIYIAQQTFRSKKTTLGQSLNWGLEKFLTYLGYTLLLGIVFLGGLFALVIPGILFGIWFSLAPLIRVVEGGTIKESFKRSYFLVRGREVEYIAILVTSFVVSIFGLLGPAAQNAVVYTWYEQLKSAKDGGQELPPVSSQSWVIAIVATLLMVLLVIALIAVAIIAYGD